MAERIPNCQPKYPNMPEDIIYNILLLLPVKTLLRFKSVCKSWLSLISSPDFINTQLSMSTNDPHFTHYHLIVIPRDGSTGFAAYSSVYSLQPAASMPVKIEIDYPTPISDTKLYGIVGYSKGLVCLVIYDFYESFDVILWNPFTRSSRKLPKGDMEDSNVTKIDFCYDEFNSDYKVFAAGENGCKSIYSSKYDSWRTIEDFDFTLMDAGVYANGAMYWAATPSVKDDSLIVVSLDMNTEMHREVLQPNYGEDEYDWTLATWGKSLSILCNFEAHADLWVMKNECGLEDYWTKMFTIPYMDGLPSYNHLRPLYVSENGQIMLQLDSIIFLYNSMANTLKVMFDGGAEKLDMDVFVESLVSPDI